MALISFSKTVSCWSFYQQHSLLKFTLSLKLTEKNAPIFRASLNVLIKIYLPGLQSVKREQIDSNLWNSQSGTPVVFKDVQADDSLTIDVAVIDSGAESNLRAAIKNR